MGFKDIFKKFSLSGEGPSIFDLSKAKWSDTVEYEIITKNDKHLVQVKISTPAPIPKHPKSEIHLLMFAKPLLVKVIKKILENEGLSAGKIEILRAMIKEDHILVVATVENNIKGNKE